MSISRIPSRILYSLVLLSIFLAAPLAGVLLRGEPVGPYMQFPPETTEAEAASFSWVAFVAVLLFVIVITWPFWRRLFRNLKSQKGVSGRINHSQHHFPGWGWPAATGLALFWVLAWNRFEWFEPFQRLTFFPIWFCFIILLNAVGVWISGRSLLTHRPLYFSLLFPASAAFWWMFEYLNRFVNNWHYTGVSGLDALQYFAESSLAFSTVLPAVMSIRFILLKTKAFALDYRDFPELPGLRTEQMWNAIGVACVPALVAVGLIPQLAYPLIWIVPGLLWIVWQRWNGYVNPLLYAASRGDFSLIWASACAALICGFFWEMWNIHSLAGWTYSVPGLNRFYLFEMPLAGYAGYLPFGVVCAIVANSLLTTLKQKEQVVQEESR